MTTSTTNTDTPLAGTGPTGLPDSGGQDSTTDQVKNTASVAQDEAKHVASEVRDQARGLLSETRTQVEDQSRTQRDRLVDTIRTFSDDLDGMAEQRSGLASDTAREVANRVPTADVSSGGIVECATQDRLGIAPAGLVLHLPTAREDPRVLGPGCEAAREEVPAEHRVADPPSRNREPRELGEEVRAFWKFGSSASRRARDALEQLPRSRRPLRARARGAGTPAVRPRRARAASGARQ